MVAKKSSGNWMAKAYANAHGQFKAKAKAAGKSVKGYTAAVLKPKSRASTKTKRQANLVRTTTRINARRKTKGK
jgi:hypothetical protein